MNDRIKYLTKKTIETFKEDGIKEFTKKSKTYLEFQIKKRIIKESQDFKDILFINGCGLPHPQRYRVDHQIEQLESFGVSCDKVYYEALDINLVKYYRCFVFYRCPITPTVKEFIKLAKENNKTTFYDIDDLVFDTKYTDKIKYLNEMPDSERKIYDDGVRRMGETLKLCEYGIASTGRLQTEMQKHLKEVYINRNVASEEMVKYSQDALKEKRDNSKIVMGYFSGSITHNDDFKLIMPAIVELLQKYDNLYLKIVGLLDLPLEMECVRNKIITSQFVDWTKLPSLIHSVDINLAPIEKSIFNEAKSENKWTEAALVKIPTVASNVGAFKDMIQNEKTGLLCDNILDWKQKLTKLIESESYRNRIGQNAYNEVMKKSITVYSGRGVADFIKSKLRKNFFFILPSTNISGGIMVVMNHAMILKKKGYDVTLINAQRDENDITNGDIRLYVVSALNKKVSAYIDTLVATMWVTLEYVLKFERCKHKKYLVQNFETNFYGINDPDKYKANSTYNKIEGVEYITISNWCKQWLEEDFGNHVKYAPNGINLDLFKEKKRNFKGKIKILIEGNSKNDYKNVDESFLITNTLDKSKFEVHYLSYGGNPKKFYNYDKFYQKIPHSKVGKIYQDCDILLKTSTLESFSYPPLEMMATGGFCVVLPNKGNIEYLEDNKNCLFYRPGNIEDAIDKINRIVNDENLRKHLLKNSKETVANRDWKKIESQILKLYE